MTAAYFLAMRISAPQAIIIRMLPKVSLAMAFDFASNCAEALVSVHLHQRQTHTLLVRLCPFTMRGSKTPMVIMMKTMADDVTRVSRQL